MANVTHTAMAVVLVILSVLFVMDSATDQARREQRHLWSFALGLLTLGVAILGLIYGVGK